MFLLHHKLKKNSADKERGRNPLSMARQLQRLSKNCVTLVCFCLCLRDFPSESKHGSKKKLINSLS